MCLLTRHCTFDGRWRRLLTGANVTLGEQARGLIAHRVLETLSERIKAVWVQLPHHLLDPPDTLYPEDET